MQRHACIESPRLLPMQQCSSSLSSIVAPACRPVFLSGPAVLDAKTLPDIFNGFLGPDPKQGGRGCSGRTCSSGSSSGRTILAQTIDTFV